MSLQLRDNLYYCVTGNRTIFMDLVTGRFFGLPRAIDLPFQRLIASQDEAAADADIRAFLMRNRLAVESGVKPMVARPIDVPRPTFDPSVRPMPQAPALLVARVVLAQIRAEICLKTRSISQIAASITRRRRQKCREIDQIPMTDKISAAFRAADLLLRPHDRCFPRSLAYLSTCQSYGLHPSLVIGVRSNPFRAHCWVQYADRILHDDADQSALFTPIFVA
jgi:hypothetical protein